MAAAPNKIKSCGTVRLFICLFVCSFICSFVCLFVFVCLFIRLSVPTWSKLWSNLSVSNVHTTTLMIQFHLSQLILKWQTRVTLSLSSYWHLLRKRASNFLANSSRVYSSQRRMPSLINTPVCLHAHVWERERERERERESIILNFCGGQVQTDQILVLYVTILVVFT